jgi:hypothetical protein
VLPAPHLGVRRCWKPPRRHLEDDQGVYTLFMNRLKIISGFLEDFDFVLVTALQEF